MIQPAQLRRFYFLLNSLGIIEQKKELVLSASQGRTDSTTKLTEPEAASLIESLNQEYLSSLKKVRGKILHLMCLMGYTDSNNSPDYNRINAFVRNRTGHRNPLKKNLIKLDKKELIAVCNQVEAMYHNQLKRHGKTNTEQSD